MSKQSRSDLQRHNRAVATWLFVVAAMVVGMIVLGGLTRLTHSGLSMVEWRPLTGWLPPLTTAEWEAAFEAYRRFPEYLHVNRGMTLAEFQGIFWLEYIHRLWGRLIGVVFAVPFAVFLLRGWIARAMVPKLVVMFVLGGLQGVLGWYMVTSGLVDRPDVSQYRLAAHLGAALVIYAYLVWVALGLVRAEPALERGGAQPAPGADSRLRPQPGAVSRLRPHAAAAGVLVFVTALSGGFVAGLDAGFAYNTFPLMDGELVPEDLFAVSPFYLSFFEDVTTVQFTHRVLALATVAVVLWLWVRARTAPLVPAARIAVHAMAVAAIGQAALGISTLVLIVPLILAAAHQAGAVVLLTTAVWATFELGRGSALGPAPSGQPDRTRLGRPAQA